MELVREYRIRKSGRRGHTVALPESYVKSLGLQPGDVIDIYREGDRLILIPRKEKYDGRE